MTQPPQILSFLARCTRRANRPVRERFARPVARLFAQARPHRTNRARSGWNVR